MAPHQDDTRSDPDLLLEAIEKEEAASHSGKLKIFLGMAAGVGKTYAMLQAAQKDRADGVDVLMGYIETHGRVETEALTAGLARLPRKTVVYHDTTLAEFDLDAALARAPAVILVDELAHTNAPESRHPKRYQDVIELLDAGVDVYTTLNVQHLESRADIVQDITGVPMRERVPDSILERANEIELVDISPEELLERLNEGKVYTEERAELAQQHFFKIGNLNALREMSLRITAERVGQQVSDYLRSHQIQGPWKSGMHLMVAVSPSPSSEMLVRWTRRFAFALDAPWLAVYVDSGRPIAAGDEARLTKNLALARELGAEVITTCDANVTNALLRVARQRNVTQIVIGKPTERIWLALLRRSPMLRILLESGNIDIHVVQAGASAARQPYAAWLASMMTSRATEYVIAVGCVCAVTLANLLLMQFIGYRTAGYVFLLTVLVLSCFVGRGPVWFAAIISSMIWNFAFIPPRFTFSIHENQDVLMFSLYFVAALVLGNLTARIRSQDRMVRKREEQAVALYAFVKDIAYSDSLDEAIAIGVNSIGRAFKATVAVLLAHTQDQAENAPHPASTLALSQKEYSIAYWSFISGKPSGRFTDTLPSAEATYLPLRASDNVVGVLGIRLQESRRLALDQEALLETMGSQLALVIERHLKWAAQQSSSRDQT